MSRFAQPQSVLDLKDTKSGRIFMMGSGFSLASQMDLLPRLADEDTWGVNQLPSWKELPFELTYYGLGEYNHMNRHQIGRFMFKDLDMQRFACNWLWGHDKYGFTWVARDQEGDIARDGFQGLGRTLGALPGGGCTILLFMQLAAWMGYREFYLLGNEFTNAGYAWDAEASRNYNLGNAQDVMRLFPPAREAIEEAGATLLDCTPNGQLTEQGILEYKPLEEVLAA